MINPTKNPAATSRTSGWYHGWNIVAVCVLSGISANAMPINAFSLFLHDWSVEMHVPISTLQLGMASCAFGCALISPLIGVLVDKYPRRLIIGFGLTCLVLFCFGLSFATRTWQFMALYAAVLTVAIVCSTSLPANAIVSRWFVRRLGLALGLSALGMGMGGVVLPPLVAAALPALGWRMIWRITGTIIALVPLPLALLVLREHPSERDGTAYLTGGGERHMHMAHGPGSAGHDTLRWRDILTSRNFWLLALAYLPMLAIYAGCGTNLSPIAASRGLSQETAGLLLSAYNFSQLAGLLAVGLLSDRLGNRIPLAGLAFLGAAGAVIIAFGQSEALLILAAMLAGIAGSFWPLLAAAITVEFKGRGFGRAFGLITFFLPCAVMSSFALAKVRESTGSYTPTLLIMAALAVAAGIACLFITEPRGGRAAPMKPSRTEEAAVPLL